MTGDVTDPAPLDRVIAVELTARKQATDRWLPVPVDLPPGLPSFEVRLEVEGDGAVVDLGCEGPDGWRGWSGGAHRRFTIGRADASPGYLPGPIEPGRWSVILGLHALEHGPVRARVRVIAPARNAPEHGPRPDPVERTIRGSDRDLPAPEGLTWYAVDTHAHSLHSDGALSLDELAAEAVRSGLDALCVTDHNTTSHHALLPEVGRRHGITLIPGQEITTHRGHANAFGDIGFVDFRRPVAQWARTVAERGGLLSVNHPVAGDCSWWHPVPSGVGAVEVLHSDSYREPISTAPWAWLALLDAQRGADGSPVLLAGGDFHRRGDRIRPGTPTTWVCAASDSAPDLLAGMAAGRTALTGSVRQGEVDEAAEDAVIRPDLAASPIVLRCGDEEAVEVIDAAGLVLVDGQDRRRVIERDHERVPAERSAGPYRLETAGRATVSVCR